MTSENIVSSMTLNMYQNARTEKHDVSRQFRENYAHLDEILKFSNKIFDSSYDAHRALVDVEEYSKPSNRGDYQ